MSPRKKKTRKLQRAPESEAVAPRALEKTSSETRLLTEGTAPFVETLVALSPVSARRAEDWLALVSQINEPSAWRVVCSAVQGVSHVRQDLPCQDAAGFRLLPNDVLLIALADGAGSARFADQGAQVAVQEALFALSTALEAAWPADEAGWRSLILDTFAETRAAVLQFAGETSEPVREFASTLSCAVLTSDWLIVGQIGDGAVVAEESAGTLVSVTQPQVQRGEYANETHFLIEEDALEQLVFQVVDHPINGLAVMSDGLIRLALKMPSQDPFPPFFQPLFGFIRSLGDGPDVMEKAEQQLASFLGSDRVNARTDDDKSLVLVTRIASPQSSIEPLPVKEQKQE